MKHNRFTSILLAATWLAAVPTMKAAELPLIPWPAQVEQRPGQFVLNRQTAVIADAAFTNEAAALAGKLELTNTAAGRENRIWLTTQGAAGLGAEAYQLEVSRQGVTIRATSPAGAFYGCQTLRQLAEPPAQTIPCLTITDAPRYAWRGLMLDVSRHFFDKPTIFHLLDWMADYKLNRLHLHLTDDPGWRLEIPGYPALTQSGARGNYGDPAAPPRFFTRQDIRDIVAYAQARHIVVVPEIDMPGHAGAALRALPQLDGGAHTFNPATPETYEFLQHVLLNVMADFPSPWLHFGGDEVDTSGWKSSGDPQALEKQFVRRMAGFIREHGRIPAGWDEIAAAAPATNTVIFWWRHDKPDVLAQALAGGYSVVLTPRAPCYLDYPQDTTYPTLGRRLFNTLAAVYRGPQVSIPPTQRPQILGVEACIWTERIGTVPYLEFMALPRLAALGETAWTPDNRRDFAQFEARLKPFLKHYRLAGIHYYDETDPQGSLRDARQAADRELAPHGEASR